MKLVCECNIFQKGFKKLRYLTQVNLLSMLSTSLEKNPSFEDYQVACSSMMLFKWAILCSLHLISSAICVTPIFALVTHLSKYEAIIEFSENTKDTKLYAYLNNLSED